ncbi:hypothetical protein MVEN_02218800 [Mycena venus]|uniref:Uncharacterized protein n=1 Tax=Mycena venus TaxID=2733690 RepID=A0A8H6X7H8_9AGAR|nr:hypothetical protein MVEN_02218800 [Mycena venus]
MLPRIMSRHRRALRFPHLTTTTRPYSPYFVPMFSRSLLRPIQSTSRRLAAPSYTSTASRWHSTDSYTKEVDSTPAVDPKIHRVDPSSENVQKPHEAPSGPYSATGVEAGVQNAQGKKEKDGEKATGMKEYSTMSGSGEKPYGAPKEDQRYGGKAEYQQEKGQNPRETSTSTTHQGPEGSESGGRKPEGR